jgi:hypothetical protein
VEVAASATGWSELVSGQELHPPKSSAFHGALLHQLRPTVRCRAAHQCDDAPAEPARMRV